MSYDMLAKVLLSYFSKLKQYKINFSYFLNQLKLQNKTRNRNLKFNITHQIPLRRKIFSYYKAR